MIRIVLAIGLLMLMISCRPLEQRWALEIISPSALDATAEPHVRIWGNLNQVLSSNKKGLLGKFRLPINGVVKCNGILAEIYPSTHTWMIESFPLTPGQNKIYCTYTESNYVSSRAVFINYIQNGVSPVAEADLVNAQGPIPLSVTFDASRSYDPDGRIVSYRWIYKSITIGQSKSLKYIFSLGGVHKVTLEVVDERGLVSRKDFIVKATSTENVAPYANFSSDISSGPSPLTVHFNASSSFDLDGTILEYAWVIPGIGVGAGVNFSQTFTSSGVYKIILNIKDDKGLMSSSSSYIFVSNEIQIPVASFTFNPQTIYVNQAVEFDGTSSYLPGHESEDGKGISECRWNFTGRGFANNEYSRESLNCLYSYQFTQPGVYEVELVAQGVNGSSALTKQTISVLPSVEPVPVADFSMNPTSGNAPLLVSVNGLLSYLPGHENEANRGIVSCAWTISPKSKYAKTIYLDQCATTLTIQDVGQWDINLTVTGLNGLTASLNQVVTTYNSQNQSPTANFIPMQLADLTIRFDGRYSMDPDGHIENYSWDLGDGAVRSGPVVDYQYQAPGSYQVQLTVTDDKGATGTQVQQVNVTGSVAPIADFNFTQITTSSPYEFSFDASASTGSISTYSWNFGDGQTGVGRSANHAYSTTGDYLVTLTIFDMSGMISTKQKTVTIENINSTFMNPNFVNGSLGGWIASGDVSLVARCTYFTDKCNFIDFAALVSNAGDDNGQGLLKQAFIVPSNATRLIGKYRFLTNELPPNNKNFDDTFKISFISQGQSVFNIQGGVLVTPLAAGVGGFKYASDIQTFDIPLIGQRALSGTLAFEVLDVQDQMIDSALVITDLQLIQE